MSPEEAEMPLEQRAKGIDQGEVRCPAADRIAEAFAAAVDDLLTALEAIAGGESS